jgi:hypothetical protein
MQNSKVKIQKYKLPIGGLTSVRAGSIFEFLLLNFDLRLKT